MGFVIIMRHSRSGKIISAILRIYLTQLLNYACICNVPSARSFKDALSEFCFISEVWKLTDCGRKVIVTLACSNLCPRLLHARERNGGIKSLAVNNTRDRSLLQRVINPDTISRWVENFQTQQNLVTETMKEILLNEIFLPRVTPTC